MTNHFPLKVEVTLIDDNEPLPNPFKLPKFDPALVKNLQEKKLTVKSMREVAKVTVDAMRVFSTHPKPDERTMVARDLIARFPILAIPDSNKPEVSIINPHMLHYLTYVQITLFSQG